MIERRLLVWKFPQLPQLWTWQEHNPAKLKSRVLIVERRYAARKLKGCGMAWRHGLWQTWGGGVKLEKRWRALKNQVENEIIWKCVFHVLSCCLILCFRISCATPKDSNWFFWKEAYWIVFLKLEQRICIFLTIDSYLSLVCVASFLDIEELVPTFDFSESNNALSMIPQKVQNQKACNVKSDILNHLHCDIGQNPQNHRVVIVIWFQHSIPESMNIWYHNVDSSSAGFRYWQKKTEPTRCWSNWKNLPS